ncbi:glycosyltransferase [Mycobacterium sp. 050134]|uniref:glycosyltransferase n=1 Tax=Mycobacterium sp. 050134 TaxID=3096111 RepID=UPI002EDB34A8
MRIVLTGYGSRGDVEPCTTAGRELQRRGHDVRMAVSPHLVEWVESAGLAAVAYGPDTQSMRDEDLAIFNSPNKIGALPKMFDYMRGVWTEKAAALMPLAGDADLLVSMGSELDVVATVAEYHGIPVAGLHYCPPEALPVGWLDRTITHEVKSAQRRGLGLPETGETPAPFLEIQAYDPLCFPALEDHWGERAAWRPFVGALTLESPTDADDTILAWVEEGPPPIFFGFGSTPVPSFADTVAMIDGACAELGERALIFAGPNEFAEIGHGDHVNVVGGGKHAAVFPLCRAVVHHGGAGVTAAGLRAGVPALILWWWLDQPYWAAAIQHLGVGGGRCFRSITGQSLVEDLRFVLAPEHAARAREVADQSRTPAQSAAAAADLLEQAVQAARPG